MELKPLFDRIIVQRIEEEAVTAGGILLPEAAQEKRQEGKVVAVGNGRALEDGTVVPLQLKGGETVLFGKYAGSEVTLEGETFLVMREDEVLAVINQA
ncbi:MAG: co-chaperone GroES [Deltaproteobacteria bacterium]|nr:co-chaperone GroES [Deltaproteobacteria bacterium]